MTNVGEKMGMGGAVKRIIARAHRGGFVVLAAAAFILGAQAALAQNPFAVAVRVNDSVVTNYEIDQRARFLQVLNAQGDLRQQATEALINERLQVAAGIAMGAEASPEDIENGLVEFAGRANLGPEQFLQQMASEGIAPETVRDFVANGITWRNVVRARFGARAQVTEEDVDRAMELGTVLGGGIELLLAEIIIPVTPQNQANLVSELLRLREQIAGSTETFSEAARRFSAAPTREAGGVTGWRGLNELPEGLRDLFLTMSVGQVTEPVPLGGGQAYALFQYRGQREVEAPNLPVTAIDYVSIAIPGGRTSEALAEAERLRNAVDTCNDFNGVIPGGFQRQTVAPGELPEDVSLALRALDEREMSTSVTRSGGTVLLALMLCDRVRSEPEQGRDAVRQRLVGQTLEAYSNGFLEELRSEARITFEN
ncbi:peptidylprolyl isomerase [Gymnodinialimonas ulvae]|uniref:peptidylprolyl isomerase n=1 Tax=Gymnodinialimonas ulvae TaxID=3126504 RepID=UPI0030B0DBA3